mgnify:CR=1 FL=1
MTSHHPERNNQRRSADQESGQAADDRNAHAPGHPRQLAEGLPHEVKDRHGLVHSLASLLEPALILAMGVMVLLIVLAVLLPIIQLNTLVR